MNSNVHILDTHPIIGHIVGQLRSVKTKHGEFNRLVESVTGLLVYEAMKDFKPVETRVDCWSGSVSVQEIPFGCIHFVAVLRAGLGMLTGAQRLIPSSSASMIGIQRNEETAEPVLVLQKAFSSCPQPNNNYPRPNVGNRRFIVNCN